MTTLFAIIGILAGLAISHIVVYRWGKRALKGDLKAAKDSNKQLLKDKAKLIDRNESHERKLKIAVNKPSAGDVHPTNILQQGVKKI